MHGNKSQPYKTDQVKAEQRSCQGKTLTPVTNHLPKMLNFQKLLEETEYLFDENYF